MAFPDVTGGSAAKERFIFPSITVPPTSVAQQSGIAVGYPVPADANRSTARLIASGGARQTTGNTPSITVKVEDLGVSTRPGCGVPRIVVRRSTGLGINDEAAWAYLTRDFALFQEISIDMGAGDPWSLISVPTFLTEDDGTFRLVAQVTPTGTGFNSWLVVKSFDPATDATWQAFFSSALSGYVTLQGNEVTYTAYGACAAHRPSGPIYIVMCLFGTTATGYFSRLHSLVLMGETAATAALVEIGPGISFRSDLVSNNISMDFLANGDAFVAVSQYPLLGGVYTVAFARSPDLRSWDSVASTAVFPSFTTLTQAALGATSDRSRLRGSTIPQGTVTDVALGNANNQWAVTDKGNIYRTANGGQSWALCDIPQPDSRYASFGFDAVSAFLVTGTTYAVYAAGWFSARGGHRSGLIYKSVDNGVTWTAIPTSDNSAYYEDTDLAFEVSASTLLAPWPLHDVVFTSAVKGWAVGDHSQVLYTADGGETWARVRTLNDAAAAHLYAVVADSSNNIMVAGMPQDAPQITAAASRKSRAILIANATTAIAPNAAACTYLLPIATDDGAPIISLTQPTSVALTHADCVVYGLTSDGIARRWDGTVDGWTTITTFAPRGSGYTAIASPVGTAATAYVLGPANVAAFIPPGGSGLVNAVLWRSTNATAATPTFAPISGRNGLRCIACIDATTGYVGGAGLYRFGAQADDYAAAFIKVTPSGAVLVAAANLTLTMLDIFRAPDSNLQFQLVDRAVAQAAQPSITIADNGDLLLACGTTGRVSTDDGKTWLSPSDAHLALPLGTLAASTEYPQDEIDSNRAIAALGGGRLFAAMKKDNASTLGVFVARDWAAGGSLTGTTTANASTTITGSGTSFTTEIAIGQRIALSSAPTVFATVLTIASNTSMTVSVALGDGSSQTINRAIGTDPMPLLSKPQWLGIDNIRGQFAGHPAVGDQWTIAPRYDYQKANLLLYDSPSVQWRSTGVDTELILLWDRQDAAVTAVIGAGQFWDACAFAVFASNVRQLYFEISDPTNDASFTSYLSNLSVGSGVCRGLITTGACNVLVCKLANGETAQSWIPGQFNPWSSEAMPGRRQYYVRIATSPESVYRIRRSTPSELVIEPNASGLPTVSTALPTGTAFTIFGDRHAWWGEAGSGPGSAGLRDTTYRYGRYVRIRIPAQPTADGYFVLGTPILGVEPYPDSAGRSFAYGFTWAPVTNTTQERGLSGVTSVETHGGTGNVWQLTYAAENRDAVMRRLHPLVDEMRKLFAIALKGNDVDSLELVRLVDAQKYQNLVGDRYSAPWVLEEVP